MTTLDIYNFGEKFKEWIGILLGMKKETNIEAVTVINGNISKKLMLNEDVYEVTQY